MPKFIRSLIAMLHSSYSEWKAAKDGKRRIPAPLSPTKEDRMSTTIEARGPFTPTGGVDSFSSMMRAEQRSGYRPPSQVGSVRSFRSIRTTEEEIDALTQRVERTEQREREISDKLDQVLALLSQSSITPKDGKPQKGGAK